MGEYGIRHEDLVEIINVSKSTDHPRVSIFFSGFFLLSLFNFFNVTEFATASFYMFCDILV